MSFGMWILSMIVIYYVVKFGVKNGMREYYSMSEGSGEEEEQEN